MPADQSAVDDLIRQSEPSTLGPMFLVDNRVDFHRELVRNEVVVAV